MTGGLQSFEKLFVCARLCVCVCVLGVQRDTRSPTTGVTGSCKLSAGNITETLEQQCS